MGYRLLGPCRASIPAVACSLSLLPICYLTAKAGAKEKRTPLLKWCRRADSNHRPADYDQLLVALTSYL